KSINARHIADLETDVRGTVASGHNWSEVCARFPRQLHLSINTEALGTRWHNELSLQIGPRNHYKRNDQCNKWNTSVGAPDWELEFINKVLFSNRTHPPDMKVYAVTTRSYPDFLHQVLQTNTTLLFAGFSLIILYVLVMLCKFNVVEQRLYLSLFGVSVVGQAIVASYGLCFYMGFFWGPIHPCLDNLGKGDGKSHVSERIGRAFRQAGVSITVTSLTDIMAFAIGTTTRMPFLRSFCMFAATGVFFLYLFGILFFVSILTLDERRLQQNRDGCCFKQKFDPMWYLDPESYPMQYSNKLNEHFPEYGKLGAVYLDKDKLLELFDKLKQNSYINQDTLDFWYPEFLDWLDHMKSYLFEFLLMSRSGQKFIKDIKLSAFPFDDFNITASKIQIQHILMDTTTEQVKAMESIQEIIRSVNLTTANIVSFSPQYVSWTANKIIGEELLRNLGLTVCTVAVVTLLLIQNLQTSFWVICCVVFTVVDLVGSMYWLGLTIEISTSIMVLLCTGLAVDYSAHIGNEFTRLRGTKNERAIETLSIIGTAVFNGGLSTFLAFVLLGSSRSYLFTTFFKLFTALVVFGLFHGLVFLPVALSWFGPENKPVPATEHKSVPVEYQNGYFQAEDTALKSEDSKLTSPDDCTLRISEET
ncbi:hypothetical protein C0J52_00394, partial [Blattella germanica]